MFKQSNSGGFFMLSPNHYEKIKVETPEQYIEAVKNGYGFITIRPELRREVFKLLEEQKDQDDALLYKYAEFLEYGWGGVRNPAEAMKIYKDLVKRIKDADAALALGVFYHERGQTDEAAKYYTIAAEQGEREAQCNLGNIYEDGDEYAEAFHWYKSAADQGSLPGLYNLSKVYAQGLVNDEPDLEKAFEYMKKAAEGGFAWAQEDLARLYMNGEGITKNLEKAVEWFEKAAEQNMANSQYVLGLFYERGIETIKGDFEKAKYWYTKAAENGDEDAINWVKAHKK